MTFWTMKRKPRNSSYRKEDTTLAFTCWIHINGRASGHNDSMKDPPILTDVKLVGGWLCTAGVSLVTQERLWSTIPFPIRVSSPRHGRDVWASSQSHRPHWAVSSGRAGQTMSSPDGQRQLLSWTQYTVGVSFSAGSHRENG